MDDMNTTTAKNAYRLALTALTSFLVVGGVLLAVWMPSPSAPSSLADEPNLGRDHAAGSPADLVERHGCWTGQPPADMEGVIPGHVVVTAPGQDPRYAGEAMVAKALGQVFDGEDHGLTIHAFCR